MLIDGLGCWLSCREGFNSTPGSAALFLDRDDLLVSDPGFLHRPVDVRLLAGAAELVGWANAHALPVILVTNQSGVGRGLFWWDDFRAVNARIGVLLGARGAQLDAVLACGWHPEAADPGLRGDHLWRKPSPGMLWAARDRLGIDLARSWMAGDRLSDMEAAERGGLAGGILVGSPEKAAWAGKANGSFARLAVGSLCEAMPFLPHMFACACVRSSLERSTYDV